MQPEAYVPLHRPCGEEVYLIAVGLQQHLLHTDHTAAAMIMVGRPVESRPPESGEAIRAIGHLEPGQAYGFFRQAETRRPDIVLFPSGMRPEPQRIRIIQIRVTGYIQVLLSHAIHPPGIYRIKLRGLYIIYTFPGFRRGDHLFPSDRAKRNRRNGPEHSGFPVICFEYDAQGCNGARSVVAHFIRFTGRPGIQDQVTVAVQLLASATGSQVTVMFVEEGEATFNQGQVRGNIRMVIVLRFKDHLAELEHGIPLIFEPGVIFHSLVESFGAFKTIFDRIGQAEVLNLFGKACPLMPPITFRT